MSKKQTLERQKKHRSRGSIVKELDKWVSKFTRERDGKCVTCDSVENLTNGHLFSRVAHSTRFDITKDGNCHTQCWGCNYRHEYDPYPFTKWYQKKFGIKKYDELHRRFVTPKKYKDYELLEMIDFLKKTMV